MNFLEKLDLLMSEENLNKSTLSQASGIPYTTIDGWYKRGYNGVQLSTIRKLADYFDTTLDYLARDEIIDREFGKVYDFRATKPEIEHIKKYRNLDAHGKDMVDTILNKEHARSNQQKSTTYPNDFDGAEAVRELPLYYMPASAGNGNYLDTTDYEMIRVADISPADKADFAIRIDGDSMEPRFTTGDIVLVKEQDYVEKGELGIFILNGDSLFKQLGDGCLISLNPKYAPRPIKETDSIYCRGKVLGAVRIVD